MIQEEGKCPRCGAKLGYGASTVQDEMVAYRVSCSSESCSYTGYEWYNMVFSEQYPQT